MTQEKLKRAISLQQSGDLTAAADIYVELISVGDTQAAVRHNLGIIRLEQGQLADAMALIQGVFDEQPDNPELNGTPSVVGRALYENQHWEAARPWLEKALTINPADAASQFMLERVSPRDYLATEVYDPLASETLLRYSPREAETYIYTIDISGTCNLRCPSCPVGNFSSADRTLGFMPVDLFAKIIAKIKREAIVARPQIWLYNWGEPLLHPQLTEIIKEVKKNDLTVHLSTNLNSEHGIAELAKAAPTEIKISLSGFTEETYSLTHKRGDLSLLKANMYLLRHYLNKYQSATRVWVGHHLYRTNSDQLESVRAFCTELNFEHQPTQAFFQPLEKLVKLANNEVLPEDEDLLAKLLVDPRDYLKNIKNHRSGNYDCELRFNQTVINHDGSVALCCSVYDRSNMLDVKFLDADHQTIEKKKYQHPFCKTCRAASCDYTVTDVMNRR